MLNILSYLSMVYLYVPSCVFTINNVVSDRSRPKNPTFIKWFNVGTHKFKKYSELTQLLVQQLLVHQLLVHQLLVQEIGMIREDLFQFERF
jgi:hypothetical protein